MARALGVECAKDARFDPDFVLCSNSARSRETVEALARANGRVSENAAYLGSLYHFASLDGQMTTHLKELVQAMTIGENGKDVRTIMVVGHNKGMEEATSELCGREISLQVATAALLEKTFDCADDDSCDERSPWRAVCECEENWTFVALATPDGILQSTAR